MLALALAARESNAGTIQHVRYDGQVVTAEFFSVQTNSCTQGIETHVSLQSSIQTTKTTTSASSGTDTQPNIGIIISVYDYCQGMETLFAVGFTDNFVLQIDANQKTARLRAKQVLINDETHNSTFFVDIDMVWSATGKAQRQELNDKFEIAPGVTAAIHLSGVTRDAAASGTITDGTTDFTPEPSDWGIITKEGSYEVDITRP